MYSNPPQASCDGAPGMRLEESRHKEIGRPGLAFRPTGVVIDSARML